MVVMTGKKGLVIRCGATASITVFQNRKSWVTVGRGSIPRIGIFLVFFFFFLSSPLLTGLLLLLLLLLLNNFAAYPSLSLYLISSALETARIRYSSAVAFVTLQPVPPSESLEIKSNVSVNAFKSLTGARKRNTLTNVTEPLRPQIAPF